MGGNYYSTAGYWEIDPNTLNIYLSRPKEIQRIPTTDYVIRYYHADGSYDTETGSLAAGERFSIGTDDKIREQFEEYSGLAIVAGHDAFTSITVTRRVRTWCFGQ